jgi:hypothetical protein
MVYPKTREKTQTRKFGSGSGRVSLNKISGFSGQTSENPKNSGRVGFRVFSGFCTLYQTASSDIFKDTYLKRIRLLLPCPSAGSDSVSQEETTKKPSSKIKKKGD